MEFHMGIRLQRNTWRAPLQLIDCWLPCPTATRAPQRATRPLPALTARFARAGWLGRTAQWATPAEERSARQLPGNVRSLHAHPSEPAEMGRLSRDAAGRSDARVVLSGRMADVCAELDRLAALEPATALPPH